MCPVRTTFSFLSPHSDDYVALCETRRRSCKFYKTDMLCRNVRFIYREYMIINIYIIAFGYIYSYIYYRK